MINHDLADGDPFPVVLADRDSVFDVDETDDVVQALADHGKAGVPGPAGHRDDLADRIANLDRTHPDPGSQDVRGLLVPERQGSLEQRRGLRRERALFRGSAYQRKQLLCGSGGGEFLLGLEAQPTQQAVGGAVEQTDRVAGHPAEAPLEPLQRASGRQRVGNRQILRNQLAINHRYGRGEHQGSRHADAPHRSRGYADRSQRPVQDARDRRFGEETDRQVGDGDTHLRSGELGGKARKRGQDARRPLVARFGRAGHGGAINRDERELGRDEDATGPDQNNAEQDEKPLCHYGPPRSARSGAGIGLWLGMSGLGMTLSKIDVVGPGRTRCGW